VTVPRRAGVVLLIMALGPVLPAGAASGPETTIGLFVPLNGPDAPAGIEARRGATIAVDDANRDAGPSARRFRLVSTASDLPWAAATGALVKLVYDEGAVAVIGALDARTAHLAEQVIARARGEAVFVTPWASEAALTRIQIPWFFSVVPDDRRQAQALVAEVYSARATRRAAIWVDGGLDTRAAAESFQREAPEGGWVAFDGADPEARDNLTARLAAREFEVLLVFAPPRDAARLVGSLRHRGDRTPVLGPLSLAAPGFLDAGGSIDGVVLATPARPSDPGSDRFAAVFRARFGAEPTPLARFAHDATAAVILAARAAGAERGDRLAFALSEGVLEGATGPVRFESRRGRDGIVSMSVVRSGTLMPMTELRGETSGRATQ